MDAQRPVLVVLSDEQKSACQDQLNGWERFGPEFVYQSSPDDALDQVGELDPCLVIVGMTVEPMEGLELLAMLMQRYPSFREKVVVLPDVDDPFPPVIQYRAENGRAVTEHSDAEGIGKLIASLPKGAATPRPRQGLAAKPALPRASAPKAPRVDEKKVAAELRQSWRGPPPDAAVEDAFSQVRERSRVKRQSRRPGPDETATVPADQSPQSISEAFAMDIDSARGSADVLRFASAVEEDTEPAAAEPIRPVAIEPVGKTPALPVPPPEPVAVEPAIPQPPPGISTPEPAVIEPAIPQPSAVQSSATLGALPPKTLWIGLAAAGALVVVVGLGAVLLSNDEPAPAASSTAEAPAPETEAADPAKEAAPKKGEPAATAPADEPPPEPAPPSEKAADLDLSKAQILPLRFENGQSRYAVVDEAELDVIVEALAKAITEQAGTKILVGGHSSPEGDQAFNYRLSAERAYFVKEHLKASGIPEARIAMQPYGASKPISAEATPEANRRVTVQLTR